MVRTVVKLLLAFVGVSVAAGVASAVAAVRMKQTAPPLPEPDADGIDLVAIMEGARLASAAAAFRGGRVVCWYGSVDLDLREATFDPAGARLEVRTAFGGTRIIVGPEVAVHLRVPAVFGGSMSSVEEPADAAEAPSLQISGFTVFGGLQVLTAEVDEELPGWTAPGGPGTDIGTADPGPAPEPA